MTTIPDIHVTPAERRKRDHLADLIEKARHHVMTPSEIAAQRKSWVCGEMMLQYPTMTYNDASARYDVVHTAETPPPQVISLVVTRAIGGYGAAFDPPGPQRAYTYQHQPHNGPAHRLGCAVTAAWQAESGDSIDLGLNLLKALEDRGFGVFEIEPRATAAEGHS